MIKFRILFSILTVLLLLVCTQFANGQSPPRELAQQLIKDDVMVRELTQTDRLSLSEVVKSLSSKKLT